MSHDYTRETGPAAPASDDIEIGGMVSAKTAEEIEAESGGGPPMPLGRQRLKVVGFLLPIKCKAKTVHVGDTLAEYEARTLGVKLALPSDPTCQVIDFFEIPPADPKAWVAYSRGRSKADSKTEGFGFNKLSHFISRIGWPVPKGESFPPEALRVKNWLGREVVAEIEMGKGEEQTNPRTGEPYPPRPSVKLFSFKAADNGPDLFTPAATAPAAQPPAGAAAQPAGQARAKAASLGIADL